MPGPVSTGMGDRIGVQLPLWEIYLSLYNHPGQLSLAIRSWVGAMSTGQRAVMLCDWGVKADMVFFASNTVWSISERVRGVCVDALYKSTFTLLYFKPAVVLYPVTWIWLLCPINGSLTQNVAQGSSGKALDLRSIGRGFNSHHDKAA